MDMVLQMYYVPREHAIGPVGRHGAEPCVSLLRSQMHRSVNFHRSTIHSSKAQSVC